MKINDEMLSAYLDNELSGPDRMQLENLLRDDAAAADRLAQLASVNALVGKQAALIDAMPMPDAVLALLAENSPQQNASPQRTDNRTNNVVELSRFRQARQRVMQGVREHAALAASLALLLGFAGGQMLPSTSSSENTGAALYAALDTVPSGEQFVIDANTSLTARFSFLDTESRYCRQYVVQDSQGSSENIACRDQDQWTLMASARSSAVADSAQYQTASGPRLLDTMLDAMMQGSALSQADEQNAISQQWRAE